jgi:hypothetical protein
MDQPAVPAVVSAQASARRGALMAWGIVLITLGVIAVMAFIAILGTSAGGLDLALAAPARRPIGTVGNVSVLELCVDVVALVLSAGLVWTGVACCIGRRWVRPVVTVLAGYVVAASAINLVGMTVMLQRVVNSAALAADMNVYNHTTSSAIILSYCIRVALVVGFGIVLPYFLARFFASALTQQLLETLDPQASWADDFPAIVLAWAAFCILGSIGALMQLTNPLFPALIVLVDGLAATICLVITAVVLAWGGWLCFRRERVGWLITMTVVAALQISTLTILFTSRSMDDLLPRGNGSTFSRRSAQSTSIWQVRATVGLEALIILTFGIYAGRRFPAAKQSDSSFPAVG